MSSGIETSIRNRLIQFLLTLGFIGPLLFIIVFLIEGLRRPEYNSLYHLVSSLSHGTHGWVQSVNFMICGLSVICLAVGLRLLVIEKSPGSLWGSILLTVFGMGLIGAGLFVADPILGYPPGVEGVVTLNGTLHNFPV